MNFVQSSTNLGKETNVFLVYCKNVPSKRLERQVILEMGVMDLGL